MKVLVSVIVGVGVVAFAIWAFFGQFPGGEELAHRMRTYMQEGMEMYEERLVGGEEVIGTGRFGDLTPRRDQLVKYLERKYTLHNRREVTVVCWGSGDRMVASGQGSGCWMELSDGSVCDEGVVKCLKKAEKLK